MDKIWVPRVLTQKILELHHSSQTAVQFERTQVTYLGVKISQGTIEKRKDGARQSMTGQFRNLPAMPEKSQPLGPTTGDSSQTMRKLLPDFMCSLEKVNS